MYTFRDKRRAASARRPRAPRDPGERPKRTLVVGGSAPPAPIVVPLKCDSIRQNAENPAGADRHRRAEKQGKDDEPATPPARARIIPTTT